MTLKPGTKLGRYEIRSQLGAGGMGEVYLCYDTQLRGLVALKILPPDLMRSTNPLQRFEQEAQATGTLNHPNILAVYDVAFMRARLMLSQSSLKVKRCVTV